MGRRVLPFWKPSPTPQTKNSDWRDNHKGGTADVIKELCRKPLPLVGNMKHPRPHSPNELNMLIKEKMMIEGFVFPMTWVQTQKAVFKEGPCKDCDAGILLDGQICQGKYDGKRIDINVNFNDKLTAGKVVTRCNFCRDSQHPMKQERKSRRQEKRRLEMTLLGASADKKRTCRLTVPTRTPLSSSCLCLNPNPDRDPNF